jgi:hypothetical protein
MQLTDLRAVALRRHASQKLVPRISLTPRPKPGGKLRATDYGDRDGDVTDTSHPARSRQLIDPLARFFAC